MVGKKVVIAHRGASGYEPEHTMSAYELAIEQGADYIEQDLQLTKDGHLICMHDSTVDRTTDGTGSVSDLTLAQIKQLDAGDGQQVPTLDEVITRFGYTTNYYIETKRPFDPNMDAELIRILKKHNLIGFKRVRDKVIVQSFSEESLRNIRSHFSDILLVYLTSSPQISELATIREYAQGVGPRFASTTAGFVQAAKDLDLLVHPYTINNANDMREALEWGVDGYFTNYPDTGLQIMEESQGGH